MLFINRANRTLVPIVLGARVQLGSLEDIWFRTDHDVVPPVGSASRELLVDSFCFAMGNSVDNIKSSEQGCL